MSIDNRYCYLNSVVSFVFRFKNVLKNQTNNNIVLELLINSSLHFSQSHLFSLNI